MLTNLIYLFICLCTCVRAEYGFFYNPPMAGQVRNTTQDPVYKFGDTIQLRWGMNFEVIDLVLFQKSTNKQEILQGMLCQSVAAVGVFLTVTAKVRDKTSYDWIVSTRLDLKDGSVFHFQIHNASNINQFFMSRYFNLTDGATPTNTPSSSSSSQTATTNTSSSSSSSSDSSGGSALSSQAKVGIGVGVGLGSAFLIALGGFIWLYRRRAAGKSVSSTTDPVPHDGKYYGPYEPHNTGLGQKPPVHPVETPGESVVEVPGEEMRHELP